MSGGFPFHSEFCNWQDIANDATYGTYGGVTVNCGNASKGSWTQLIASAASDIEALQIYTLGPQNTVFTSLLDLGIGAAGSEVPIISNLFVPSNTGFGALISTPILPFSIPAGTRISARGQASGAGEGIVTSLRVADGGWGQGGFAGVDGIGADTINTRGTLVTSGTALTKGSWTQIVASAARDYAGFFLTPGPQSGSDGVTASQPVNIDIGIGAAGSEVILVPDIMGTSFAAATTQIIPALMFWTPIPAGSRIALRWENASANITKSFVINGVYK